METRISIFWLKKVHWFIHWLSSYKYGRIFFTQEKNFKIKHIVKRFFFSKKSQGKKINSIKIRRIWRREKKSDTICDLILIFNPVTAVILMMMMMIINDYKYWMSCKITKQYFCFLFFVFRSKKLDQKRLNSYYIFSFLPLLKPPPTIKCLFVE